MKRILPLTVMLVACGSSTSPARPVEPGSVDATLLALATGAGPWTYWRNSPDTLASSPSSGHGERRLRTRYNALAATQLDPTGRVRANPVFPDSSLIVKELYTGSRVTTYAVMLKLRASPYNSESGWLWAELDPSGGVKISATERGGRCVGCHRVGAAVDFTRMNDAQR
jgi:hypothetical protein